MFDRNNLMMNSRDDLIKYMIESGIKAIELYAEANSVSLKTASEWHLSRATHPGYEPIIRPFIDELLKNENLPKK